MDEEIEQVGSQQDQYLTPEDWAEIWAILAMKRQLLAQIEEVTSG